MKDIGISMFGGGMRSVAYAGFLKAIDDHKLTPKAMAGSSGGSLVVAPYSYGKTPEEIFEHFNSFKILSLLNPYTLIFKQKLNYKAWENHFAKFIPANKSIENAKIKLFIHATNIKKQESEWFETGSILKSVIASSAFFGVYKLHGKYYVDGDYDPETGIQKLKEYGCKKTIFVHTTTKSERKRFSSLPFNITQKNALNLDLEVHKPDYVCEIKLKHGSILGKRSLAENYEVGYITGMKFLKELI